MEIISIERTTIIPKSNFKQCEGKKSQKLSEWESDNHIADEKGISNQGEILELII